MGPSYERSSTHKPVNNRTLTSADAVRRHDTTSLRGDIIPDRDDPYTLPPTLVSASTNRLESARSTGGKVRPIDAIAAEAKAAIAAIPSPFAQFQARKWAAMETHSEPIPRRELTGKETGMQGPFTRADCVSEPIPEIVLGDEGPVHDSTRRDQQWPADFAVITLAGEQTDSVGRFMGRIWFCLSETDANTLAAIVNGLAYKVHSDKALTLTIGSMA